LFKIATQNISLDIFIYIYIYIYIYNNLNCFISSIFFFLPLVPVLTVISTGWKILYSYLYRE
jgi:hypothetical protein